MVVGKSRREQKICKHGQQHKRVVVENISKKTGALHPITGLKSDTEKCVSQEAMGVCV